MMDRRHFTLGLLQASGLPAVAAAAKPAAKDRSRFPLQERKGSLSRDADDYLGTRKSEATSRKALLYLARSQNSDGSWGDSAYTSDVAIAGLSMLAFLSAGHQPDRGPHGKLLRQGADYLKGCCQRTGLIHDPQRTAGRPMYSHGFGTLALAELYGMTRRTDLRDPLEKAVELILKTQNAEGGWRYEPRVADADISVVICQIMALRAAVNAGVPVPRETTDRAIGYVKRCANNADGGFSYRPEERGSGQARTGAGVLSLIVMGDRNCDEVKRGLDFLMRHPPGGNKQWLFYGI
ncbi:MAG: Prenyltransferase-like, partial [Armatimonadetes bacterium]|nr:Prenyltransferase-like [Armatimonadota bacterium]